MFQGFKRADDFLDSFLSYHLFYERDRAENDARYKQIIPYCVLKYKDKYLYYVRNKGGEKRLNSKGSIGIGGHLNSLDFIVKGDWYNSSSLKQRYLNGLKREIEEELNVKCKWSERIIGLINDDSNEVGRVHLGVVHIIDLESDDVTANEETISELKFLTVEELKEKEDELENWSKILIDWL